jgi:hypothetical protein
MATHQSRIKEARMKVCNSPHEAQAYAVRIWCGLAVIALGITLAAQSLIAQDTTAQDKNKKESNKSVGFILSGEATEKDLGLPIYPGARQHKDNSDDSPAVTMGLWGGSSGFKLVVLKLESDDPPEKVAAFYRKALVKYGQVLDCGKPGAKDEKADADSSNVLTCEDDQPAAGGFTLKAGTKAKQHAVGIQPNGKHSLFQLVYVEAPKSESKKN